MKRVSQRLDPRAQVGSQAELHRSAGLGALSGDPGKVCIICWPDRETWVSQGRGGGGGSGRGHLRKMYNWMEVSQYFK